MKLEIIVKGEARSGKTTFVAAMGAGHVDPKTQQFPETKALQETDFITEHDTLTCVELPANLSLDLRYQHKGLVQTVTPIIVTVIKPESKTIEEDINKAKAFIDAVGADMNPGSNKPMLLFVLVSHESEAPADEEENYIEDKMLHRGKDFIIEFARRMRDEVVTYAVGKKSINVSQGFYSECLVCDVWDKESVKTVYNSIKYYAISPMRCFRDLQSAVVIGSLKERMHTLLKELEQEYKSRFALNKEDKLVKIRYLRKVLHVYEESPVESRNDAHLKGLFEYLLRAEPDANRVILEKGLSSRVKAMLVEVLSQDQKYLVELMRYRDELLSEAQPWKPYLNKPLKRKKADFLTHVIDHYKAYLPLGGSLNEAYKAAYKAVAEQDWRIKNYTVEEVTQGVFSRVKTLLANIPKNDENQEVKSNAHSNPN